MKRPNSAPRYALILAAGKGIRMNSEKAKVLHSLCGKPLVAHVLDKLAELRIERTFVVVGHEAGAVKEALRDYDAEFVLQKKQSGTGHAVMAAAPVLKKLSGSLLVLYGDTPRIESASLLRLLETREREAADEVLLTAFYDDPDGYGRIIRDPDGQAVDIIEEQEATREQRALREVNPGFYCFKIASLLAGLPRLSADNQGGEYYLTDMVRVLCKQGKKVIAIPADRADQTRGINTREELAEAESVLRQAIARKWMLQGVTLLDPASVFIDDSVTIGADTVIYPGVLIEGRSRIGPNCVIGAYSHLKNAVVEEGAVVDHCSVIRNSTVGKNAIVGPFAHLRQNAVISSGARVGNFVEIKNSSLGEGTTAAHLSYLGDAEIGRQVNIGAGTITCNFDGVRKNKTIIKDHAFIGSDSQLVAPVTIHEGAQVGAGSSITEDVPPYSLAIARSRQVNKKGWAKKKRHSAAKARRTSSKKSTRA